MGRFNTDFAFTIQGYTGLSRLEESVLTAICRVSDDDTDASNDKRIGSHAYCSIKDIAMHIGTERSNVSKAMKSLEKKGWIKRSSLSTADHQEGIPSYVDTMFVVNIAKMVRVYVCKETFVKDRFNYKDTDTNNPIIKEKNKIRNEQAKALLESATTTFPDDFETLWITSTVKLPAIEYITDWRKLVDNSSEEDLLNYWIQYRQRYFSIAETNTKMQENTEEQGTVPSTLDDRTIISYTVMHGRTILKP